MLIQPLMSDLKSYAEHWKAGDDPSFKRYLEFVASTPECCERSHLAGHCTGSAFVVSPDRKSILLLFHPFLQRWLQPGGHADGSPDLLDVARREAHEETGLPMEALISDNRVPFDLDIHAIPEKKSEPAHYHYDLRYLLTADPSLPIRPESEKMKVAWLSHDEVRQRTDEESVLRMLRKLG